MKKRIYSFILILFLMVFVGGIGVFAENQFSINIKTKTINVGDENNPLVLQIKGSEQSDKKPKTRWTSWNENVARVDQEGEDGIVTGLRKGKAIISSGVGFPRETCLVTVVEPSIRLNKTNAAIYCGKDLSDSTTLKLKATVKGADKEVTWSSSNENIIKVDAQGNVTCAIDNTPSIQKTAARSTRTATITAAANGKTASCKVTILDNELSLNVTEMQLSTKGAGSTIKLQPTIIGATKKVTWQSSNTQVATVKGGKVTGKSEGEAVITATANGVTAECKVKVQQGISINEEKILLYAGDTSESKQLKTNAPKNASVAWSISGENTIAEVDSNGLVTAKKAGTAIVTATYEGKTDTCLVEVKETDVTIAENIVHLKTKGNAKTYTLDYHVTGRKPAVKWTSADKKVVSVSKGKLTAKKAGTTTVTAEANGVKKSVKVIVQEFAPTITLNQSSYTLYTKGKGNTITLKAKVDGASKKVEWHSSNKQVAEVSAKGKVTVTTESVKKEKDGRVLITATANGVTAKCWIQVKEAKVDLEKKYYVLRPTETATLSVDVVGANQSVKYVSTNAKAVSVKKGIITAKKLGEADIKVTANGITEICHVWVSDCKEHKWNPVSEEDQAKDDRAASCTETGIATFVCSACGAKKQDVTPILGHQFGRWTVATKATENAAGLEKQVCSRCGEENTRMIPAKNSGEISSSYQLVWEDDFNGEELNTADWNYEYHEPGWVNAELQEYVDAKENIYVKDGKLYIQAIKEGTGDKAHYTSGRINTQGKHDFQYGRFEVKAKVPSGKGFLPAFWMMPTDESYYGQWPKCGEIDIMEVHGSALSTSYSTLHFGEPHTQKQGTYDLPSGEADFGKEFHVFACEWDPDEFRFYVDDTLFYTVNDWFTKRTGFGEVAYPAPYDQPFYVILNLAVGGSWVGYPEEDAEFGENAQFVIDYVKVYQKESYNTDVDKPETEVKLRDPDSDGNYIINGDFSKEEDLSSAESNWQLLLAGEGEATAAISDKALHVTTTNAGSLNYSVQIVQANLPMQNNYKYELTYDAYADDARTMITGISAPDRGYIRYLDDTIVDLTKEKQSFRHEFNMTADSDANGRVEFNLGNQGSTAAVHISNVKLKRLEEAEQEEKGILPDGNYVYNGQFNEGNEPKRLRLAYWDWNIDAQCKGASVSVTEDFKRELKVVVPDTVSSLEQVTVYQNPIAILGGKKYVLSFDARADKEKTIKTKIAGQEFSSALTTETKEYKYEFETAADLQGSEIRFLLGTAGTTFIDNVRVQEDGLLVNGDFSSGMTGYEVYVNDAAKVSNYIIDELSEDKAFSIDIADTGKEAWYIQLKQNNIKLEKDKWYKLAFDAKSTTDRKIMYALQRDGTNDEIWTPYSGEPRAELKAGYQKFETVFKMKYDTDPNTILSISMGAVDNEQVAKKHTIVIDNITLEETDPQPEDDPQPEPSNKNFIQNGDFAAGEEGWENAVTAPGAAEVSFADGKAVYQISNVGTEDWHIQLKYKTRLTLENDAKYRVTMKIKSTKARTVKYAFLHPENNYDWYDGEDLILSENELKEVNYEFVSKDTNKEIQFLISMGQIADVDTPASTIEIDDISLVKLSGEGGNPEEPENPEEPKPVEIGTELIKNGDFAKKEESWTNAVTAPGEAEVSFDNGKAVYQITNVGTEDWNIQLKQSDLTLEKGATYKVNLKIKSTVARTVKFALLNPNADYDWYGGDNIVLNANRQKSISRIVNVGEDKASVSTIDFVISMGQILDEDKNPIETPISTIEISDISITKVAKETAPDEETETDPPEEGEDPNPEEPDPKPEEPDPDPEEPDPKPEEPDPDPEPSTDNMIQNGDFAQGEEGWENAVTEPGAAEVSFDNGKAVYQITSVGNEDWHIQLKYKTLLTLEKDAKYQVTMKIKSTEARMVKYAFLTPDYAWYGGEDLTLAANELKEVNYTLNVDKDTNNQIQFLISLGQIKDNDKNLVDTPISTIEIDDICVTKVQSDSASDKEPEETVNEEESKTKESESGDRTTEESEVDDSTPQDNQSQETSADSQISEETKQEPEQSQTVEETDKQEETQEQEETQAQQEQNQTKEPESEASEGEETDLGNEKELESEIE